MKSNYKKLGDFIQQVKKRNNDNSLTVDNLRGINISKEFMQMLREQIYQFIK